MMNADQGTSPVALAARSRFSLCAPGKEVYGTQYADHILLDSCDANVAAYGGDGDDIIRTGCGNDLISGGSGNDTIHAGCGDDIVCGGSGNDLIQGAEGCDVLVGGDGMDNLFGGKGDDVLSGGKSFDLLMGDEGDDIFVFRRGDGSDTIFNERDLATRQKAGRDVVYFPDARADQLDSVRMEKEVGPDAADSYRMVVDYGQGDRVTIRHQQCRGHRAINAFRFADGTELSTSELFAMYAGKDGTLLSQAERHPLLGEALSRFHLSSPGKVVGGEFLSDVVIPDKPISALVVDASAGSATALRGRRETWEIFGK